MNRHSTRAVTRILAGATLLALTAVSCSLPGRSKTPAMRVFLLNDIAATSIAEAEAAWPCLTLRVATPRAAPGFNTRRMAYTRPGEALQYFAWHEWADTPAQLLALLVERRLDSQGRFGGVLSGAADVATDLRLELDQLSLLQTVQGSSSDVSLAVKATLIDLRTRRILDSRRFRVTEAAAANPTEGAAAAERAASQILDALTAFVANAALASEPACSRE